MLIINPYKNPGKNYDYSHLAIESIMQGFH